MTLYDKLKEIKARLLATSVPPYNPISADECLMEYKDLKTLYETLRCIQIYTPLLVEALEKAVVSLRSTDTREARSALADIESLFAKKKEKE